VRAAEPSSAARPDNKVQNVALSPLMLIDISKAALTA
jgi:hypothetical protein